MNYIYLFNRALKSTKETEISFELVNLVATSKGYTVHPDCCTNEVLMFLKDLPDNYNTTFYTKYSDVANKTRMELLLDQIKNYSVVYGHEDGEPYVANTGADSPEFLTWNLKLILPICADELADLCQKMLYSGIAMKQETIEAILPYVGDIEVDRIKNREALMFFCDKAGVVPTNPVEFVRFLIFKATGKTLLIKDKETITNLKLKSYTINLEQMVDSIGQEKVASVFYRFKEIFLALKRGNESMVNKLNRLAKNHHVPMEMGYFETLLSGKDELLDNKLISRLESLNNFKKVKLLETILIRNKGLNFNFYPVRNGKMYLKNADSGVYDTYHYAFIFDTIYQSLVKSLSKKACSIKLPVGIEYAVPSSEKSFVGNYPLGTTFDIAGSDSIIGINWKGADGAQDIDLSYIDTDGRKIGWNSQYYNDNKSIIYSGDMTTANPEATELLYCKDSFLSGIVHVNLYAGKSDSKFTLFFAKENIVNMDRNYMVDRNNILFEIPLSFKSKQHSLGVVTNDKFIISEFRTGNGRVSGSNITNKYAEYVVATLDCRINLSKLLTDAGFTINNGAEKLDMSDCSKDMLINLLS